MKNNLSGSFPQVAVLICVYKNDQLVFFRKAIDSVRTQTYPQNRIHIYLGMDGPVLAEIESYIEENHDYFYKIVRHDNNHGLGKTLNSLIDSLKKEQFVFRMDADDVSLPERFKAQTNYLLANSEIQVLGTALFEVDYNGKRVCTRNYPCEKKDIFNYICKASPVAHPTVCFRRNFFEKGLRYPENTKCNEDIALWYEALLSGAVISNIPEPLYNLTVSRDFFERRSRSKAFYEFAIYIRGIWRLHTLTWRYIYPLIRLLLRLAPTKITKAVYNSRFRGKFLNSSE